MKREKYAEWWATPPRVVGPAVVVMMIAAIVIVGFFVTGGRFQEAVLTCVVAVFLMLAALLDLVAEMIRYQKLVLERLGSKSPQD